MWMDCGSCINKKCAGKLISSYINNIWVHLVKAVQSCCSSHKPMKCVGFWKSFMTPLIQTINMQLKNRTNRKLLKRPNATIIINNLESYNQMKSTHKYNYFTRNLNLFTLPATQHWSVTRGKDDARKIEHRLIIETNDKSKSITWLENSFLFVYFRFFSKWHV